MRGRPIPIPTLDEFILLHKVVRAALRLQPDMLDMIEGARRAFGWNVLGACAAWVQSGRYQALACTCAQH